MFLMLLMANLKMVVYLFGALVFTSMAWLYFDALAVRPQKHVWFRGIGSFLIAISYLAGAVIIEGNVMEWGKIIVQGANYFQLAGFIILGIGVWGEPLSKRPGAVLVWGEISSWIMPALPALVGLGYLRRATIGLERHLKGMATGMYILAIAEILDLRKIFLGADDIRIYELVRDFGLIWGVQLIFLFIGLLLISKWVFSYLLRRFETQITLFLGMLVVAVFAMSTMVFSYVMGTQLEQAAYQEVRAGGLMTLNNWARESDLLEQRAAVLAKVETQDKENLAKTLKNGEHILDSEYRDLITREKREGVADGRGYYVSGIGSTRKVWMQVLIKRKDGYVLIEQEIGGEKLENVAESTAMATRLYVDKTVVATSSVPGYPKISSPLGQTVKKQGKVGGVEYSTIILPLKSSEGVEVASLETAKPLQSLWESVSEALFWTYLVGIGVLIVLELPAFWIAKYITKQI